MSLSAVLRPVSPLSTVTTAARSFAWDGTAPSVQTLAGMWFTPVAADIKVLVTDDEHCRTVEMTLTLVSKDARYVRTYVDVDAEMLGIPEPYRAVVRGLMFLAQSGVA